MALPERYNEALRNMCPTLPTPSDLAKEVQSEVSETKLFDGSDGGPVRPWYWFSALEKGSSSIPMQAITSLHILSGEVIVSIEDESLNSILLYEADYEHKAKTSSFTKPTKNPAEGKVKEGSPVLIDSMHHREKIYLS